LNTKEDSFNLNKKERLNSEKLIEQLFRLGKSKSYGCLRIVFKSSDEASSIPVQVMFSAPKKNFKKATDRNLLKRRMKEAYRLNKFELINNLNGSQKSIKLAFLFTESEIKPYSEIEKCAKYLLHYLLSK
jgi:ribonuclease P protein component